QLHSSSSSHNTQALTATLSGATGTSGQVKFTSSTTTAGQNTFDLSVSGLTASQTYAVQVDGTGVGQVTTDTSGNGNVTVSNLTASIAAGTTVSILDSTGASVLSGTLAAGSSGTSLLTASARRH